MFTKDNLHHARIEDIVSDLLSRIETLESNRQEIQSTMQNNTIIKAISEKIERLEAENKQLLADNERILDERNDHYLYKMANTPKKRT